ncbi:MAG TPA: hypothetical protein VMX96_01085 [Dehalococcoidia bacterium]|nr:hypothetical protein [Dehalococcoidia bacterium]
MFKTVATITKSLEDYRPIAGDETIEELKALAVPLRGAKVLHGLQPPPCSPAPIVWS